MPQATQTHRHLLLLLSTACLVLHGGWLLAWQLQQRLAVLVVIELVKAHSVNRVATVDSHRTTGRRAHQRGHGWITRRIVELL
ncbi:hypothetical protein BC831DRAFT_489794, partial [Entophlyctis helioformis]